VSHNPAEEEPRTHDMGQPAKLQLANHSTLWSFSELILTMVWNETYHMSSTVNGKHYFTSYHEGLNEKEKHRYSCKKTFTSYHEGLNEKEKRRYSRKKNVCRNSDIHGQS
jgi:hypothetical protein